MLFLHEHNVSATQVEVLSQQLNARDKNFSEISSKNKELSEDLEKVTRKLSEVELQLEKQQQRDAQHQQQDVKNCQQVRNCYQTWDFRCQGSEHHVHLHIF